MLNALHISSVMTGTGYYSRKIIEGLVKVDRFEAIYILVRGDVGEFVHSLEHHSHVFFINTGSYSPIKSIFFEQVVVPFLVRKYAVDLYHNLSFSTSFFASCKKIITVHDLFYLKVPETFSFLKRFYYRFYYRLSIFSADKIIAVSNSTKYDLIEAYSISDKAIFVVYEGGSFDGVLPPQDRLVNRVTKRNYFLAVGRLEKRKNLVRLIEAYSLLDCVDETPDLVIVGKADYGAGDIYELVSVPSLVGRVHFTGYLAEEDLFDYYSHAFCLVYPSLYEGFGLPIVDAQRLGIPVITSSVSSMPEVAGVNSSLLVDPLSVSDIAYKMSMLIADKFLYQKLSILGRDNASRFDWEHAACQTVDVYFYSDSCGGKGV